MARSTVTPTGDAVPLAFSSGDRAYDCGDGLPNHFSDVEDASPFCRHTHYLWARSVIDGYPDGTYQQNDTVTREQMSKFLANAFGQ